MSKSVCVDREVVSEDYIINVGIPKQQPWRVVSIYPNK